MDDLVSEYCTLAGQGAAFDDERLVRMRQRMTHADLIRVEAMLRNDARDTMVAEVVKIATRPDGTLDERTYVKELKARDPEGFADAMSFLREMADAEEAAEAGLGPPVPTIAEFIKFSER